MELNHYSSDQDIYKSLAKKKSVAEQTVRMCVGKIRLWLNYWLSFVLLSCNPWIGPSSAFLSAFALHSAVTLSLEIVLKSSCTLNPLGSLTNGDAWVLSPAILN